MPWGEYAPARKASSAWQDFLVVARLQLSANNHHAKEKGPTGVCWPLDFFDAHDQD